jgi:hypothetical protein
MKQQATVEIRVVKPAAREWALLPDAARWAQLTLPVVRPLPESV